MSQVGNANEDKLLEYLKKVTLELHETKQRLRDRESADGDPVAVVGMACRFPGGVDSPEGLWRLLAGGVDAMGPLPADRGWDQLGESLDGAADGAAHEAAADGAAYAGGFLDDAAEFDAALFGISPREALAMDPQQRVLLEVVWESLERSGIAPDSLRGLPVGVWVGTNGQDYPAMLALSGEAVGGYGGTGSSGSVLSGRVAYALGLEGPAVTVDTACSASLVALHLAAASLRAGECELALAGGVTVMSTPAAFVEFARQGGLAGDGRCKAFSDDADGTSWGEGAGMLVLERLSEARRRGHRVLAVLRGSAVNQDGASNGLTAPNGPSQQRVIRAALANAGLAASDVDAVEAHGTGTSLGDPIEAQALLATYGRDRAAERPLWLGSIKSNVGHTQAAAGVAGVMKMVLAMQHELLPKTLHVGKPSTHVDWSSGSVRLLTGSQPWPKADRPRRAGISAFGISGTNAHVVIEQAPDSPAEPETEPESGVGDAVALPVVPWLVSARSHEGVAAQAERLLGVSAEASAVDVGLSLATTRAALEHRAVVLGADAAQSRAGLEALAQGGADVLAGSVLSGLTGFVFSGQGGQRLGMGRELAAVFPVFAAALDEVCARFDGLLDRSLREVIIGEPESLANTGFAQPALFAVQVALFRLLESWGVRPDYVVGHSIGELAAAHVAGVLSLEDACALVAARARLMAALPAGGAMWAVRATLGEVSPLLVEGVSVAAVNAPGQVVLSGERAAVEGVAAQLADHQGRWLEVSHAFHSALMDPMLDDFRAAAAQVTHQRPEIPIVSTLTGELVEGFTADYWVDQVRGTVRFADAIESLRALGVSRFLEVGPDGGLVGALGECTPEALAVPVLRRDKPEPATAISALSRLWISGCAVDWQAFFAPTGARITDLPTYAFQHQRYWPTVKLSAGTRLLGSTRTGHPLLHAVIELADSADVLLLGGLSVQTQSWLRDHQVAGQIVFPGTGFLELALCAGDRVDCTWVDDLTITEPLVIPDSGLVYLQVLISRPDDAGRRDVQISSRRDLAAESHWTRHATGTLVPDTELAGIDSFDAETFESEWPPAGAEAVDTDGLYRALADAGLVYGPTFRGLQQAWRRDDELFISVSIQSSERSEPFNMHPAALDSVLHALALGALASSNADVDSDAGSAEREPGRLPFSWSGVTVHAVGATALRGRLTALGPETVSLQVADVSGRPVASVDSLALRPMSAAISDAHTRADVRDALYQLDWLPVATPSTATDPDAHSGFGRWAVLGSQQSADLPDVAAYADLRALRTVLDAGAPVPDVVVTRAVANGVASSGVAEGVHAAVQDALELLQSWLADARFESSKLVFTFDGAVAARPGDDVPNLAGAAVWGLVRSAQSEHPGRFQLIDLSAPTPDASTTMSAASALTAAVGSAEPQIAVRDGALLACRLVRASVPADAPPPAWSTSSTAGTVLVTGATGELGGVICRQLVAAGVRHLLLLSRRGPDAPGATALAEELAGLGAEVTLVACDAADRDALAAVLDAIPADRPLTGVVHAAGVIADATINSLMPEQVLHVLRPKVDAAVNLHELTQNQSASPSAHPLSFFVLFSSVSAALGAPGQGNYAAANAFLDALAEQRRAAGLPALSLGWGLWAQTSAITGGLGRSDLRRIARGGVVALSEADGAALFDLAPAVGRATVLPVRLDLAALNSAGEHVAPVLSALVRRPRRRVAAGADGASGLGLISASGSGSAPGSTGTLTERLASLPDDERQAAARQLVRDRAAAVLGHDSADGIALDRPFRDLGIDSLSAVELRNQLTAVTGVRLPATLVFDHPTPALVADLLLERLLGGRSTDSTHSAARRSAATATSSRSRVADDPVVIVGMACRFPGGVQTPDDLWQLVITGTDGITPFPADRGWDLDRLYDSDPQAAGASYVRHGGFLHDAADFDAAFFGISPREALVMDPQQRLLLETSWETVESAGIDPVTLRGHRVGVFAGVMYHDYLARLHTIPSGAEGFLGTGGAGSVVTGRVAYLLGLEGPAVTVDTACSSSLVALHLAAQALREGECELALAGGVTVMATPGTFVDFSRQRGLAADGRCKSFASAADGTGWAEGAGMLLVERLSDARRNGHPVLAVVRGSAVNQDGASNGLTAPNGPAQQRVIRQALDRAGLRPTDVDAVEGHGTGTVLGDPIEVQALLATYGQERENREPLWLGSLKSNIGHAQAAAGVGGVIKTVLALRHGVLPPTLHVDEPTAQVDWTAGRVELLTEAVPWKPNGRPRRAGVSSFGISGTNAHVIIEEPAAADAPSATAPDEAIAPPTIPLLVSARTEDALRAQATTLREHLTRHPELAPLDVAASLATGRTAFDLRALAFGRDRDELVAGLDAIAAGAQSPRVVRGRSAERRVAFLFTGQGSQRLGMGRELYQSSPVFAEALDAVLDGFAPELDRPLRDVMWDDTAAPDGAALHDTQYAQPALFALEVALYRLFESYDLRADHLVGHSVGELAAAHAAGMLTLADASRLVAARGRLMQALPPGGAMAALRATEAQVTPLLSDGVDLAAVNGPRSVVVSGEEEPVLALAERFAGAAGGSKRLRVSHAFHSARMDPMLAEFRAIAESVHYDAPRINVISTLGTEWNGAGTGHGSMGSADYWVRQVRGTVRFRDAIAALRSAGVTSFVELGPDAALTAAVQECLDEQHETAAAPASAAANAALDNPPSVAATLRRDRPEADTVAAAVANLLPHGTRTNWQAYFAGTGAKRVDLPTYAFQRRRFWAESTPGPVGLAAAGLTDADHPLLGASLPLPDGGFVCTGRLSTAAQPWLADHRIAGAAVVPGTAMLELAAYGGDQVGCGQVTELVLAAPLPLDAHDRQLRLVTDPADEQDGRTVRIYSRRADAPAEEPWTLHATGKLEPADEQAADDDYTWADTAAWPPEGAVEVPIEGLYDAADETSIAYGPAFQGLRAAWRRDTDLYAEVELPDSVRADASRYGVHPALLDAALHGLAYLLPDAAGRLVPFSWNGVTLHAQGAAALRVRLTASGPEQVSISAADPTGQPVADIEALTLRPSTAAHTQHTRYPDSLFQVDWTQLPSASTSPDPTTQRIVLVGSDSLGIAEPLAAAGAAVEGYADVAALAAAVSTGMTLPDLILTTISTAPTPSPSPDLARAARQASGTALETAQAWLAEDRLANARLVFVTRAAVADGHTRPDDVATAPVWGLVRSAQTENPGRFVLVDVDSHPESLLALPAAIATSEPQLAIREGQPHAARLARAAVPARPRASWNPEGTVLLTGATGALGALVARHLVTEYDVRHLLLVSRSATRDVGEKLRAQLAEFGAEVAVAACDAADRDALARLLDSVPEQHPLTVVVHLAGVLDDGVISTLTPDRLDTVFRPKIDAAVNLHELTRDTPLAEFVLFSSSAATFGAPGQGNYAAANAFLDALAEQRRADGLPAKSLAWGAWEQGMAGRLDGADRDRMARSGVLPLSDNQGLELFDDALRAEAASLVPIRLDTSTLGEHPAPLLRGLAARRSKRRTAGTASTPATDSSLPRRLRELAEPERSQAVLDTVRAAAAAVLGHDSADAIPPQQPFLELGFDSLTSVELRNALATATALPLPAALVFDHASPAALADHLSAALAAASNPATAATAATTTADSPASTHTAAEQSQNDIGGLFRQSFEDGRLADGFALLQSVAKLRPTFASAAEVPTSPAAVRLAKGPEPIRLVCFSSQVALGGVHQYARFASAFRDVRDVIALAVPGFAAGEPLPATEEALVDLLARTVRQQVADAPFALLGSSSGGILAHAAAARLDQDGTPPAGVVLLDTHVPGAESLGQFEDQLLGGMFAREALFARMDSARLSAMSWYFNLLGDWTPGKFAAPVLLVRAGTPMPGGESLPPERWQTGWTGADHVVDVPGNHFTMMEDLVADTAQAVDTWLRELPL